MLVTNSFNGFYGFRSYEIIGNTDGGVNIGDMDGGVLYLNPNMHNMRTPETKLNRDIR